MRKSRQRLLENRFRLLSDDSREFFECSQKPSRKSLHVNTLKTTKSEVVSALEDQGFTLRQIPWASGGYWAEGSSLSDTVEYFLGHYYLQESSMMIPPEMLEPVGGDVVLDVAAAPGGKTIYIAGLMENSGCIVANEPNAKRRKTLRFNLSKYGVLSAVVSSTDFSRELKSSVKFSKILLDAPCSCEGQFRKNPLSWKQWSLAKIIRYSRLQKKMLANALELLQPGGVLVYSTCTLAPEENEEVVDYALKNFDDIKLQPIGKQKFKYRKGLTEWNGRKYSTKVEDCVRVYPQDNDTEGFFTAKIVKCAR